MALYSLAVRHIKTALLGAIALGFLVSPSLADTLKDAMALAYQGNPNLLAARAQLRATDENVPIAVNLQKFSEPAQR